MRPLEWTLLLVLLVRPCGEGTPWWCRLRVGRQRSGANHPQQSPIFCHSLEAVRRPSPSTSRSLRLDHLLLGRLVRQPIPEPTLVCQGSQPPHMTLDDGQKMSSGRPHRQEWDVRGVARRRRQERSTQNGWGSKRVTANVGRAVNGDDYRGPRPEWHNARSGSDNQGHTDSVKKSSSTQETACFCQLRFGCMGSSTSSTRGLPLMSSSKRGCTKATLANSRWQSRTA